MSHTSLELVLVLGLYLGFHPEYYRSNQCSNQNAFLSTSNYILNGILKRPRYQ